MVIDLDDPRALVKKAAVDRWDHATPLDQGSAGRCNRPGAGGGAGKGGAPSWEPSVELLAREAWQAISQGLPSGIVLERAVIRETPTCSAEISRDRA